MTHIMIEDTSPEGKWLLELIRNHNCVTVVNGAKPSFKEAAKACNAVPVSVFTTELRNQINERFEQDA